MMLSWFPLRLKSTPILLAFIALNACTPPVTTAITDMFADDTGDVGVTIEELSDMHISDMRVISMDLSMDMSAGLNDMEMLDLGLSPDMSMMDLNAPPDMLDMSVMDQGVEDMSAPDMSAPDMSAPDMSAPDMSVLAVCGNGVVEGDEACDEGEVQRSCAYGELDCVVCNEQCELVAGEVSFCGDGVVTHGELCDEGANNNNSLPYACRTDCHPDRRDALVPFLQNNYIVQGVASSCEARPTHECDNERLYLSLYFKDAEGNDASAGPLSDRYSLIVEINPNSPHPFALTRCWELSGETDRSHVGGLAFARTLNGTPFLYVSGAGKIERFLVPDVMTEPEHSAGELSYGSLEMCGLLGENSRQVWPVRASSFVSHVVIEGSDKLLAGRFCSSSVGCDPRAYAYDLNMRTGELNNLTPSQIYLIRVKAQGVDVLGDELFVSVIYGDNNSYLYRDQLSSSECSDESCSGVEVTQLERLTVKGGVAGGEDLARVGTHLWSASESGSRHFQNRFLAPWSSYFPYLYDLSIEGVLHAPSSPASEAVRSRHLEERHLLRGRYAEWWDRPHQIFTLDVNGDGRDDVLLGPDEASGCWFLLEGSTGAQGAELIDRGCVVTGYAGWWDNTDRIRAMDVNGDGRDDVVIGPYSVDGCWYVLEGRSTPTGASLGNRGCVVRFKGNWSDKSERIRSLDLQGDGADDILIGPSSAGAWYLLEGRVGAQATFATGRTLSGPSGLYGGWWDDADRVRVLDINGDGRDDVVIGPYSVNGCWYVLEGLASGDLVDRGCVVQAEGDWAGNSERFWQGDFNGDGRDDLLLGPSGVNGNWYLLAGASTPQTSLRYAGSIHSNYEGWSDNARRIRVIHPQPNGPSAILIGPKSGLGEWQLLQGHAEGGLYDKQWAVDLREDWGEEDNTFKPERIRALDVDADGRDEVLIGPSSNGNWYLLEGLSP